MAKRNVSFIKPPEPAFIRRLKERVGYQEGPNVETKKEKLLVHSDDEDDIDDERPTVVVLKEGDLSAEDYFKEIVKEEESKKADLSQKPVFQKPKRTNENPLQVSSKKLKSDLKDSASCKEKQNCVQNTRLLSFEDEDQDEDE